MRRCPFRLGRDRCELVREHPGFGHVIGNGMVDEPWPLPPRPNWYSDEPPMWRPWWRREARDR